MGFLHVTMPDDSVWAIPARLVAEPRARYYAEHDSGVREGSEFDRCYADELAHQAAEDVIDWAHNNMNWGDVSAEAQMIQKPATIDFQDGWVNGEMRLVKA